MPSIRTPPDRNKVLASALPIAKEDSNMGGDPSSPESLPATHCSTGYFHTELTTSKLSARIELERVLSCQFHQGLFCMV